MATRKYLAGLMLTLTLAGCVKGNPDPSTQTGDFPVQKGTSAIKAVSYDSSLEIPGPGVFFIDVASGKVEAWLEPSDGSEPTGLTRSHSVVQRYDWQGTLLGEFRLDGRIGSFSPDGKLLAWTQNLDDLSYAAVVSDAANGTPLFRVAGTTDTGRWLADGSQLLVQADDEYSLVSPDGEITGTPSIPQCGIGSVMPHLIPAPDTPDLFVYGLTAFDRSGQVLREINLPRRDWLVWGATWGTSSQELTLSVSPPSGKGFNGYVPYRFPLKVQKQASLYRKVPAAGPKPDRGMREPARIALHFQRYHPVPAQRRQAGCG